jgi:DNA modification methylase
MKAISIFEALKAGLPISGMTYRGQLPENRELSVVEISSGNTSRNSTVRCHFSVPGMLDLYLGDSLRILPTLSQRVDLVIADPPYGVGWQSNRRRHKFRLIHGDKDAIDVPELLRAALRLMRSNHKHVYVFGPKEPLALVPSLTSVEELIWDKCMMSGGDLRRPWGRSHEQINFGIYCPSEADRNRGDGRLAARLRRASVLRVSRRNSTGVKRHPTEKPVSLIRQLIESSSMIGDGVLDPCCGSGSTLV